DAEVATVTENAGDGSRQVMQIEHRIGHAGGSQLPEDSADERLARARERRVGAHQRQRPQACGEARRQDQRRNHESANTMSSRSPSSSRLARKRLRYDWRMNSS